MLKPVVTVQEKPLYTKGCAHESDEKGSRRTPVSEDLCHIRSANPKKRKLCDKVKCTSPYKAKVMYRSARDRPDKPIGKPGQLELMMAEHFAKNPPTSHYASDDEDDNDENVSADEHTVAQQELTKTSSSPASTVQKNVAVQPAAPPKDSVRRLPKRNLQGADLLAMASKTAQCRKDGVMVADTCARLQIDQSQYYALVHIHEFPPSFKAVICSYEFSLSAVMILGKFPDALRGQLCSMLACRNLTLTALTVVLHSSKRRPHEMRSMCERLGILWPESLDESGNNRF